LIFVPGLWKNNVKLFPQVAKKCARIPAEPIAAFMVRMILGSCCHCKQQI